MAKFAELDQEVWDEWVSSRPPVIQELCALLPPDRLYRLKSSGYRVTILSYSENKTVTVGITEEYNFVLFNRQVFDVKPECLEECDLPNDKEPIGRAFPYEATHHFDYET